LLFLFSPTCTTHTIYIIYIIYIYIIIVIPQKGVNEWWGVIHESNFSRHTILWYMGYHMIITPNKCKSDGLWLRPFQIQCNVTRSVPDAQWQH
jgi:hypothetical protein